MKEIKAVFVDGCDYVFKQAVARHYKIDESSEPDFVFYGCWGSSFIDYKHESIKIFCTPESFFPNFNYCDYAIGTHSTIKGERYFRYTYADMFTRNDLYKSLIKNDELYLNRKFCNFIYSNRNYLYKGTELREDFCKKLSAYKQVDCPGRILNNMPNPIPRKSWGDNWHSEKIKFISNYKFTIAFENTFSPGYITEKLQDPITAHSVPIYLGAEDVTKEYNSDAFINVHDYKSFDEAIDKIMYLDQNDDAYLKMINSYPYVNNYDPNKIIFNLDKFCINIIENGKKYTRPYKHVVDTPSRWYKESLESIVNLVFLPLMSDQPENLKKIINDLIHNIGSTKSAPMDFTGQKSILTPIINKIKELQEISKECNEIKNNLTNIYDKSI